MTPRVVALGAVLAGVAVAAVGAFAIGGSDGEATVGTIPAPTALPDPLGTSAQAIVDEWNLRELDYGDDHVIAVGGCSNGREPGRVEAVSVGGATVAVPPFGRPAPDGALTFELTSVGSDRFEAITPPGASNAGQRTIVVRADCAGSTTGLVGPSVLEFGFLEWDIANTPITDQPTVVFVVPVQPTRCGDGGRIVDARLVWRESVDGGAFDDGALVGEEHLVAQADGTWSIELPTSRYIDELATVGHTETTRYRCDYR